MTALATSIIAVTVYPDRALLTRRGALSVEAGLQNLEITELPLSLNPDSLRASARGTASARLLGVQVKHSFYVETPSDQIRRLEEEIEKLQDEIKSLDARVDLIKHTRLSLDKLGEQANLYATALAAQEMTIEQQDAIFVGLRQQSEQLDNETQAIQINRREAERRLQKLTKELEQLHSSRPRERYTASVEMEILEPGDLSVDLSYLVTGAGWKPLYDLRLVEKDGNSSLEVGYLAQVTQTTGEFWEQVALKLSTARPAIANVLPELDPWYIQPAEPAVPIIHVAEGPQVLSPAAMKAQPTSARGGVYGSAAKEMTAEIDAAGTTITYVIPGATTIPPDGAAHKVTVARFPLTPRLDYVSAPKLAPAAYRRAKIDNTSPYTLLAGNASIFVEDEYIGTTPLELTVPQGEIELYLGNEERIKVERELKRRDIDKRLIGGKRHMAFGYEIELQNLLPIKISLTLHDQFPVTRHEDIKVRLETADPKPTEQTELGLLDWKLSLEPMEKRTVRLDFSVECPHGMEITGLP
jgi:uncharacterized protein (TIGR02231 family)